MKLFAHVFSLCFLLNATIVNSQNVTDAMFEGDIIADYDTISTVYDNETVQELIEEGVIKEDPNRLRARGSSPQFMIWNMKMNANDLFVITAYISPDDYTETQYRTIKKSLKKMARKTGVMIFKFPKAKPTDGRPFLHYAKHAPNTCASYVGWTAASMTPEGQPIYLDNACMRQGTIQHETMHALGFWHEQSRPDRDDYVEVEFGNIRSGTENNFKKQVSNVDSLGAPYDYNSVMHYHAKAFTATGYTTIVTPEGVKIGQRDGISNGDKLQLRLMYQCSSGPRPLSEFKSTKCNAKDCKCGKNWSGCGSDDDKCKGKLVCINNKCKVNKS